MKFLVVVAPPSIYHGCSTWKTFWEEKFTGKKQDLFEPVNMRNCGQHNVRKHRKFKDSGERVTFNMNEILKISEEFDKMETTSSESKVKMEGSGKWLVTALALKKKARLTKYKKVRYAIVNVSMKDLSNKIKQFETFVKVPHLKNTTKHEPTLSYFHLVECLRKYMMRSGENNHHVHDGYEKEMASSSDVKDTDKDKDQDKSNNSIARSFDEPSAENIESESDCNIVNATTELNYEDDVKLSANVKEASYFNIFESGRNILDKLDVTYHRVFTASEKTSREVRITTRNRIKKKKPSPVASPVASPVVSSYESPMTKKILGSAGEYSYRKDGRKVQRLDY